MATGTGKITNSRLKTQSFFFDCADPSVNFTDGFYATDMVLKNRAAIITSMIKFEQDLTAYPALITINIRTTTSGPNALLLQVITPLANVVDAYYGNTFPISMAPAGSVINNNNVNVNVQITGLTGSGVTALSFMVSVTYIEFEF